MNDAPFIVLMRELEVRGFEVVETTRLGSRDGFRVQLKNGWTVSVVYHGGSYTTHSSERMDGNYEGPLIPEGGWISVAQDAEVAAWPSKHGDWYQFEDGDTVKGYQDQASVSAFIHEIAQK